MDERDHLNPDAAAKGEKRASLMIQNLEKGAKAKWDERQKVHWVCTERLNPASDADRYEQAIGDLDNVLPGAIQMLNSMLDYDKNGTITREELCAAQQGDFEPYPYSKSATAGLKLASYWKAISDYSRRSDLQPMD